MKPEIVELRKNFRRRCADLQRNLLINLCVFSCRCHRFIRERSSCAIAEVAERSRVDEREDELRMVGD